MPYIKQVRKDNVDYEITPLSTAPIYDPSAKYSLNDYCFYDGTLYRCKTKINTPEAWNAEHWEATTVGEIVKELKTKLANINIASGTCSSPSNSSLKQVTLSPSSNSWATTVGGIIAVKFTNSNTSANPSIAIGNSASPIWANGAKIGTDESTYKYAGQAGRTCVYMYNGAYFVWIGWDVDLDTVYSAATQSGPGLMSASDKVKLDGIETGANKTVVDNALDGESTNPVQNAVVTEALDGKADIGDLAPAYSTSGTYAVGDYVTYNGDIYRCTTAISTAEAWTAAHWTQVAIGDELSSTKADLSELRADLKSDYAPIINAERSAKYSNFSELGIIPETTISDVSVKGLGIARFVAYDDENRYGDFRDYDIMQDWGTGSCVLEEDHWILTGTSNRALYLGKNNSSVTPLTTPIPSGTKFYFGIIVKGDSSGGASLKVTMNFFDENDTRIAWNEVSPYDSTAWIGNRTLNKTAYKAQVLIGKDVTWTCDGLEVYPFVFASENCIIDNNVIALDADYPLNITGWSKLSTAPYTHSFSYKADTKTYIDNHTPDDYISIENLPNYIPSEYVKESELVYISPEMYGAVGDGTTDDTVALQACIDAASVRSDYIKPVLRGYGVYKTTQPLRVSGSYLDFFIKAIQYTGNDAALIISAGNSVFAFNNVDSTGGAGIRVLASTGAARVNSYEGNILSVYNRILSDGNSIELIRTADSSGAVMYNTFNIRKMLSYNGNCIYATTPLLGTIMENDFFGMNFIANNGFAYYANENIQYTTIHDYCIENNVKNGIHGYAELYNCRTVECMNHYTVNNPDSGMIFVFDGIKPDSGAYSDARTPVSLLSINVDNALSWDDLIEKTQDYYADNSVTPWQAFMAVTRLGSWYSIFENCYMVCESGFAGSTARLIPGKAFAYLNHVAFKPNAEWRKVIDSAEYVISLQRTPQSAAVYVTPTVFDIDVASTSIYLDWSYCCIAINKFKVIQYADKKAKVYDKYGTLIFDGTLQGAGVYTFECSQTPIEGIITMRDGTTLDLSNPTYEMGTRQVYNGTNEAWTVTKAELI